MDAPIYRADIDGLRAIAVLAVIGFHGFPDLVPGGFVGVDVFFVISGYLISAIIFRALIAGCFSFATFYARRIKRIFPAFIVILAACLVAGWFLLYAGPFEQLGKHIAGGAGFVANFVLWREAGYFDGTADTKPLLHLWSLGIEEQFYLVWPLVVVLAWHARLNLLVFALLTVAASFAFNLEGIRRDLVGTFYAPWTRFWELTAGSALAAIVTDQGAGPGRWLRAAYHGARARPRLCDVLAFVGFALVLGAVFGIDHTRHFPGLWAVMPVTGTCLLIALGPTAWLNRTVLSTRAMVGVGLISYPLYLWHWPLLSFARLLMSETPPAAIRAAAVIASFVLAWLTYQLIERPIRFGPRRRWVVPLLCLLLAVCFAAGYRVMQRHGFVERPLNREDKAYFLRYYESFRRDGIAGPYRLECDFMDLRTDGVRDAIAESCTAKGSRRTLFLWGDSHAQALGPGIRALLPPGDVLAQVATSGCRPSHVPIDVEVSGGRCQRANDYALARIAALGPDLVLLAQAGQHDTTDWSALATHLRRIGARQVLVVGPVPGWSPSLPLIVTSQYWGRPYDRVGYGLNIARLTMDRALMTRYAQSSELTYVSIAAVLCRIDDCVAVIPGSDPPQLITFDASHLTPDASRFVATAVLAPYLTGRK